MKNLRRVIEIGRQLGTANIRIFSFHPPGDSASIDYDSYLDSAIDRIGRLVAVAEEEDVTLLLENEKGIVGDTLDRCVKLVEALQSEHLVFLWDPANFVQVGEERLTERGWPLLGDRVGYVHIKDCTLDGTVKAAGEGDGQVPELLTELVRCGYKGYAGAGAAPGDGRAQQRLQRPGRDGLRGRDAADGDARCGGGRSFRFLKCFPNGTRNFLLSFWAGPHRCTHLMNLGV